MKIAVGQFEVGLDPDQNLAVIDQLAERAALAQARLLVLPEGIISRNPDDPDATSAGAQSLDGPFVSALREISRRHRLVVAGTVHVPAGDGRAANVLIMIDHGKIVAEYHKLHLYDAFGALESDRVVPGDQVPPLVELDGLRFGLMTCYDVRFPELARSLAVAGADVLLLPAAWVRGPLKEHHWQTTITARALDNTVYVVAAGEISRRNCGNSMVVDPLGVTIAALAEEPGLLLADVDPDRIAAARASLPVLSNRRFATPVLESIIGRKP